ncbi:MAG: lipid IV(A) 3-deoxy-D-manno-octulosonic acid transferase [Gammaproteobacteria bacterium]|nr:lipid IV(A) 3-deoxy-D-manno-octulosonic acid transferase [Gammaproteobacteria bacterium]
MLRFLYTMALWLALPFVALRLLLRAVPQPEGMRQCCERFGLGAGDLHGPIWIHAVSVGEVAAAVPLVQRLHERGVQPLLVTTTTMTGQQHAHRLLGGAVSVHYLPLDVPSFIDRLVDRLRPRLLILMETELWPNLLEYCRRQGVPVVLVNARLSETSTRGYRLVRPLTQAMLESLTWIAAQTEADGARFRELGATAEQLAVTGNLKFDVTVPEHAVRHAADKREELAGKRPIWIAASTGAGEEELVLDAFRLVCRDLPEALLVLAPRHPHRADEVERLCLRRGFAVQRHTAPSAASTTAIYLLDTVGELFDFYALADVAFVGGSLNGAGGHNVLEPAALGVPVLVGPDTANFAAITEALVAAGGACRIIDAVTLGAAVTALLLEPERRHRAGTAGRGFVTAHGGATERVLLELLRVLRAVNDQVGPNQPK